MKALRVTELLFDGERLRREPLRLEVAGGTIAAVRAHSEEEPIAGCLLDARGDLVLPGLINAHGHIARAGMFRRDEPISIGQVVRNMRSALAAVGVHELFDFALSLAANSVTLVVLAGAASASRLNRET